METRSKKKNDGQTEKLGVENRTIKKNSVKETERAGSDQDVDLCRPPIRQSRRGRGDDYEGDGNVNRTVTVKKKDKTSEAGIGHDYEGDVDVNRTDTVKKDKTLSSQDDDLRRPPIRQSRGIGHDYEGDVDVNRTDTVKKDMTLSSQEKDDHNYGYNDNGDERDIEKEKHEEQQYFCILQ